MPKSAKPVRERTTFNAFAHQAAPAPSGSQSWWVGAKDHRALSQRAEAELERMRVSRFGRVHGSGLMDL